MEEMLEKLKNYKILYCEDNKDLRMTFKIMLKKYSENIILAKDGLEGLELFKKERPDIVITDIDMPNKNGLDLTKDIKEIDSKIPIIIATSHDSQRFLFAAIDEGVDKFLVKPIKKSTLLESISKIVKILEDEKMAKEYREKLEAQKLHKNAKAIISQFAQIFTEPIMILQNKKVKYINDAFIKVIGKEETDIIIKDSNKIDDIIEKREGFCSSFSDFSLKEPHKNKISTYLQGKRRIYQVVASSTHFKGETDESIVYIFQDITIIEYQKLKIQNYSERLEDYLIKCKYKDYPKIYETEDESIDLSDINEEKRELDNHDADLLRRTHIEKISASEYVKSIGSSVSEDLDELKELEDELDEELSEFFHHPNKEALFKIVSKLDRYANTIKNLPEFDELAKALFSTRDVLSSIENVDEKTVESVKIFLEGIFDDLRKWRETIFETMQTEDIHYLDASLFSSCLQLELALTGVKPDDDGDDFEFF